MSVAENIAQVRACIEESAKKSGRRAEDIRLVAVSKTVDLGRIREALGTGIADLGENRVQEMMEKMPELPKNVRWHMIGRLQKNKVKYIIGKTELIHSLCSLEVAAEIDAEIKRIITASYAETERKLTEHMDKLHTVAQYLFLHEKLDGEQFDKLMKGEALPEADNVPAIPSAPSVNGPENPDGEVGH